MPEGSVDAVFLTADSREQALECIAHLGGPEIASIAVVDNASVDGTAAAVAEVHPDVTVIALDNPTGLATALNRGAVLGSAPFILFLNDDVVAAPCAVRRLLDALERRPDAVAAGGRLVNADLTTQERYLPRRFPSPIVVVARMFGLERVAQRLRSTAGLRPGLDDHATVAVDQPAGACILVRRSIAERIGGWDERYWFWYEDVDFCLRLAAHGPRLYVPGAAFRHVGGATARRLPRHEGHRRLCHGVLVYAQTHYSTSGRALVAAAVWATAIVRAARARPGQPEAAQAYAAVARAAHDVLFRR